MALSFVNIFKKEDAETESNGVEHVEASGTAETQNDEVGGWVRSLACDI